MSKSGFLVGQIDIIDKISKANRQIFDGLVKEQPENQYVLKDYHHEILDALTRIRIRAKTKKEDANTNTN